ncbi:hypothetical protein Q0F98_21650 [Paenibacillus amylolyticus]|nr:hypothetical protein Q0F98_21650 [Paenibacillus amylolyticus]
MNDGVFEVNTEIENLEMFNTNHSQIDVTLTLEKGLSFVDENGKELNATSQKLTFRKDVPPEQAAQGIEFIPYKPGEVVAAKWRVKGTGKAWPSTRQYMVTVSSPETEKKLETAAQESEGLPESEIRAIYESSRAGFIFPATGWRIKRDFGLRHVTGGSVQQGREVHHAERVQYRCLQCW